MIVQAKLVSHDYENDTYLLTRCGTTFRHVHDFLEYPWVLSVTIRKALFLSKVYALEAL